MMEDKRRCPNCGHPLHTKPYLMSRDPKGDLVWTAKQRWIALYLLLFIICIGGFAILARHIP